MELLLFHPVIAFRDCQHCLQHVYWELPDDAEYGKPLVRGGNPVKRNKATPPPCRTKSGCKKGTPEKPKSLTPKNLEAYEHYRQCRAVGQFPDDAIVKQNAAAIRQIEDLKQERDQSEFYKFMATVAAGR